MADRRGDRPVALRGASRGQSTGTRRSIRLKAYDYSTPAAYFVTVCTQQRARTFVSAASRRVVEAAWLELPNRFTTVEIDELAVMPDHVHFIIWLVAADGSAAQGGPTPAPTLGRIVGAFKTVVAAAVNRSRATRGRAVWQRGYYEHIVRNDRELEQIRSYIQSNPQMAHSHDVGESIAPWRAP
jgi:REP element-mobilizing transposase RayT